GKAERKKKSFHLLIRSCEGSDAMGDGKGGIVLENVTPIISWNRQQWYQILGLRREAITQRSVAQDMN
ncbi:MAG: hypothetical protein WB680_21305, partial [Candidatus Acidiferrales bacterium]